MKTRLARRRSFQCLHRYEVAAWSDEKNLDVFGACFTPNGHGHDYEVEAYIEGPLEPESGMILNLVDVDRILGEVVGPLNGKHLNFEVPEFAGRVPTTEVLGQYLFKQLQPKVSSVGAELVKLRLYEYADLWVDVWP
jgi:6-pyruvoyltetrahydropterin/6-carboxytetrahydropterin synthase